MGSSALAIPFQRYFGQWQFGVSIDIAQDGLYKLLHYLQDLPDMPDQLHLSAFEMDLKNGLFFNSNIPYGYGLGSSGALVAGFYDRYAIHKEADHVRLKETLAKIESAFHGASSGIDPLVSCLNQPIMFNNGTIETPGINLPTDLKLFLIDTKISRQTAPFVSYFKDKMGNDHLFNTHMNDLESANRLAIEAVLARDELELWRAFSNISQLQHTHMTFMIPEDFIGIWQDGLDGDYFKIKLCGAGGGGMILGVTSDYQKLLDNWSQFYITDI